MDIPQFKSDFNLSKQEVEIIKYWSSEKVYEKNVNTPADSKVFNFMDGPPFVSGSLHYGHVLVSVIKSCMNNYMQMRGYTVMNKNGKDCHGLPIEQIVNKQENIHTSQEVRELGIDIYNNKCRELISKFSGTWKPIFERIGRFMDFDNEYKTLDANFMESVWWGFGQTWKKDLIYRGYRVMPFSTACATPLSNFEAGQNYKEVCEMSLYVNFPLKDTPDVSLIAWTTTPWTLPSNLALCVNPNILYVKFRDINTDSIHIVARDAISNLYPAPKKNKKDTTTSTPAYVILEEFLGSTLNGVEYIPLFDYFSKNRQFKVICDTYVSPHNGTGVVHQAPAFGEDDYNICVKANIVDTSNICEYCPVNDNGYFTSDIHDLVGRHVKAKDVETDIIIKIKNLKRLFKTEMHPHTYPFCYRTDTPLIYKIVPSFFLAVTKIKDKIIENNKKVNWSPSHIGENRFNNWLENIRDWGISRSRFFGTPIPVWISDDMEEMVCISSIDELVEKAGLDYRPTDIHREFIDGITIPSSQGKGTLKRVDDIFDCWFESGSVPFAQHHYPFENNNNNMFDKCEYLSDFICEGVDQCRGWFYTLMVLSTALFDKPAYKNVICSGLILGTDGKKMSKSLGNFVDPNIALDEHGADSVRLYLLNSPATHADSFKFNGDDIVPIKGKLYQWLNGVKFFIEHYTKFIKDGHTLDITNDYKNTENMMDNWILSRVITTQKFIYNCMSELKVYKITDEIMRFIEDLINWYIKFNRNRIKGRNSDINDQRHALSTLHHVLLTTCKLFAPFIPFLCETIYQKLKLVLPPNDQLLSIHHCRLYDIVSEPCLKGHDIEEQMCNLQSVAGAVRSLRSKTITAQSVKTPLNKVVIASDNAQFIKGIKKLEQYLVEEINTLHIEYKPQQDLVKYTAKPNHKQLGSTYRKLSKAIGLEIAKISNEALLLYSNGCADNFTVHVNDVKYVLDPSMLDIGVELKLKLHQHELSSIQENYMVIIDSEYSSSVKEHHIKRLFCTAVQDMRKNSNLRPWNVIKIFYDTSDLEIKDVVTKFNDVIVEQLLYSVEMLDNYDNEAIIVESTVVILESTVNIVLTYPK